MATTAEFPLLARKYRDAFPRGTCSYSGLIVASDAKVYFVVSWDRRVVNDTAQLYCMDPATGTIHHRADLGEAVGEQARKFVGQSKVHVPIIEHKGKLYFATHIAYYDYSSPVEAVAGCPDGYAPYPGGHFLSYDLATCEVKSYGQAPTNEGIITLGWDPVRERLYGLTWATGCFLRCDLDGPPCRNLGPVLGKGEGGRGAEYRRICRGMAVDPRDGRVYWSETNGRISRYNPKTDAVDLLEGCDLNLKEFGDYDRTGNVLEGNIWRTILWYPKENVFYGLHWRSEYLFKFDPARNRVEAVHPFQRVSTGRATLGLTFGPDGETLYYAGIGSKVKSSRDGRDIPRLHLFTYHIPTGRYTDHGAIVVNGDDSPQITQSLACSRDGMVYTVAWFDHIDFGLVRVNLLGLPDPGGRPRSHGK